LSSESLAANVGNPHPKPTPAQGIKREILSIHETHQREAGKTAPMAAVHSMHLPSAAFPMQGNGLIGALVLRLSRRSAAIQG
jgi:hypothetical protein